MQQSRTIYHNILANYFSSQPLFFDADLQKKPHIRKCAELPYQQTNAELWDEITETLCKLDFIQAKAVARMTYDLVNDYFSALKRLPEDQGKTKEDLKRQERMEKYTLDLIAFAKGEVSSLDIPQSKSLSPMETETFVEWDKKTDYLINEFFEKQKALFVSSSSLKRNFKGFKNHYDETNSNLQKQIKAKIERIKTNPTRFERIELFQNFIGIEANNLHEYAHTIPHLTTQLAWNFAVDGPIGKAADEESPSKIENLLLLHQNTRPFFDPFFPVLKILKGHSAKVNTVCITPNGNFALSGSDDKTLILWNLRTGQILKKLYGHTSSVLKVALTPDSKRAVSASRDNTIILWELSTGQELLTLTGHTDVITTLAMTPDGKFAISGSSDKTIIVWDLETCQVKKVLVGHTNIVTAVCITPDCKFALSGSLDNNLIFWSLEDCRPIKVMKNHDLPVTAVSITPYGEKALVGYRNGANNLDVLLLWNLKTGQILRYYNSALEYSIEAINMTPDARIALSSTTLENYLLKWNLEIDRHSKINVLEGHNAPITDIDITPDSKYGITSSYDKTLILWDLDISPPKSDKKLKRNTITALELEITANGKQAVYISSFNELTFLELESARPINEIRVTGFSALGFIPGGKHMISSYRGQLIIWDIEPIKEVKSLSGHKDLIKSFSISSDGKYLLSGSRDKTLILWDIESGLQIKTLEGDTGLINAVCFIPNGKYAISASDDNTLTLWDIESGKKKSTFIGHSKSINAVAVTPDGNLALSGSEDSTLILWDLQSGSQIKVFKGHSNSISAVRMTSDGKFGVSGSTDGTVIIWDLESGKMKIRYYVLFEIISLWLYPKGFIVSGKAGKLNVYPINGKLNYPEIDIITLKRTWNIKTKEFSLIFGFCPHCGKLIHPRVEVINTISCINSKYKVISCNSPCLCLPKKVWEDPGLLSNCPICGGELKFNPFIAGGENTIY